MTSGEVSINARYFYNTLFFLRKSMQHLLQRQRLELKGVLLFCFVLTKPVKAIDITGLLVVSLGRQL